MSGFSIPSKGVLILRPLVKRRIEQLATLIAATPDDNQDALSAYGDDLCYLIALERAFAKAAETEDAA